MGVRADPLWRNPLCLAKARCLVGDPLTPKIAKRSLRGGTESEGQPSVQPRGGSDHSSEGGSVSTDPYNPPVMAIGHIL